MSAFVFKKGCNQDSKPNMESRENFFVRLNQARVRSSLKPTVPKPFRLRTKERSDLRGSNAEKRLKQVKGKADSLKIERLPNSSVAIGSHLEKESVASVPKDVIPSPTRTLANRQSTSRPKENIMPGVPELECKVHMLQGESTTLSTQLTLMQRDSLFMIAEIDELQLRLQNMEQEVHMQHDEFFALHDALWEPVQHLELVTGQTMPNYGSQYGINQKSTVICSDISTNNGGQPVAAAANPLSTATLVRADSPRTSIDPLDFISLECSGEFH